MPEAHERYNIRLLLVEDEIILALDTSDWIREKGYKIVTVNTGEAAVEAAHECPDIGLILMDVDLGKGIDGIEAVRRIQQTRHLPIIFLSSRPKESLDERLQKVVFFDFLQKEKTRRTLIPTIERALERYKLDRSGNAAYPYKTG